MTDSTAFDWRPFLLRWSGEWADSLTDGETRGEDDEDARQARWLGLPSASEERIAAMEERLGRRMPPSYREFLKVSDGWRHAGGFVWLLAGTENAHWHNNESGLADMPLDQTRAVDYATRFYLIGMYLRYDRMYFYNWGGTKIPLVLQAAGGPPTAAARAVNTLQHWLAGARITSCGHGSQDGLPGQVWQCRYLLADSPGRVSAPAVIRWTETGTATMPADHNARAVRTLDGTSAPAPRTLRITEQPVLITL
jgi:hypothetical protein